MRAWVIRIRYIAAGMRRQRPVFSYVKISFYSGSINMATATWNGTVIAESDATVMIEGNHYFPADSIKEEFFVENDQSTVCSWKGTASYFDLVVDGETNSSAAWTYKTPLDSAQSIQGHVAFYRSVDVAS